MQSLEELEARRAKIEQMILSVKCKQKTEAVARVAAVLKAEGLEAGDLLTVPPAKPSRRSTSAANGNDKRHGKVPPKFKDPVTAAEWSGRGLQPRWVKAALASGASIDSLKISKQETK